MDIRNFLPPSQSAIELSLTRGIFEDSEYGESDSETRHISDSVATRA